MLNDQIDDYNFCMMIIFMTYLTIGYESPMSSAFKNRTKNTQFLATVFLHILGAIIYLAICHGVKRSDEAHYFPSYPVFLTSFAGILIIAWLDEHAKDRIRRVY